MDLTFLDKPYQQHMDCPTCPSPKIISQFFDDLLETLFPEVSIWIFNSKKELSIHLQMLELTLDELLTRNPMVLDFLNDYIGKYSLNSVPTPTSLFSSR